MHAAYPTGLMWFRRDLRAHDNAALCQALDSCAQVHCAFVFDRAILDTLPRRDRRVEFIRESVAALDADLRSLCGKPHAGLIVRHAVAADEVCRLARELGAAAVFANHDDEPQSLARDATVRTSLAASGIAFHTSKDHVVFERRELLSGAGTPYTVFTPYKKAWLARLDPASLQPREPADPRRLAGRPASLRQEVPSLADLGFEATNLRELALPSGSAGAGRLLHDFLLRIDEYDRARDYPAVKGPSYLGVHLRFGTVSIRHLVNLAIAREGSTGAATWLGELIWRDFFAQVLANFPHVADENGEGRNFRPAYDAVQWEEGPGAEAAFAAWCEGRTGYPLVDAAMAQINQTGYMHNRLRMVVASFLTKDLGIDWRRGERYFAEKLNDYELASNNGGWQWAASTGCDAQPYFRIFNPVSQSEKFDRDGKFIARYLPVLAALPAKARHAPWTASPTELAAAGVTLGVNYPAPIVRHEEARQRTLARYAAARAAVG
jgi:deoxyribodipyrimidine photo-lyase